MRFVVVIDSDWEPLGAAAAAFAATGCEAIVFQSALRALAYCERPDAPLDAVFIHLDRSGPGAGLWLADQIARSQPGIPIAVTSSQYRPLPGRVPQTITLWQKPVTRQMIRDIANGRKPPPLAPVQSSIVLH